MYFVWKKRVLKKCCLDGESRTPDESNTTRRCLERRLKKPMQMKRFKNKTSFNPYGCCSV